jgi:hypothetical protein
MIVKNNQKKIYFDNIYNLYASEIYVYNNNIKKCDFNGLEMLNADSCFSHKFNCPFSHGFYLDYKTSEEQTSIISLSGKYFINKHKTININYIDDNVQSDTLIVFRYTNIITNSDNDLYLKRIPSLSLFKQNEHYYPLTIVSSDEFIEGYWQQKTKIYNPLDKYPFPVEETTPNDEKFKKKLLYVMETYVPTVYLGSSLSRLTNEIIGNKEYKITNNGTTFTFPEGLKHYYIEKNVRPSTEFYNFIIEL